jgi:hypothetical protein
MHTRDGVAPRQGFPSPASSRRTPSRPQAGAIARRVPYDALKSNTPGFLNLVELGQAVP